MSDDQERRRAYLERAIAECDRIDRTARSPELRTAAAAERLELRAQLSKLDTEATTA